VIRQYRYTNCFSLGGFTCEGILVKVL